MKTYDGLGQLTREEFSANSTGFASNYYYDTRGNRTSVTLDPYGAFGAGSVTDYLYDLNNRLITEFNGPDTTSYNYDPNGNLVSTYTRTNAGGAGMQLNSPDAKFYAYDAHVVLITGYIETTDGSGTIDRSVIINDSAERNDNKYFADEDLCRQTSEGAIQTAGFTVSDYRDNIPSDKTLELGFFKIK